MHITIVNLIIEAMQDDGQHGAAWVKTVGVFSDLDAARRCMETNITKSLSEGNYEPASNNSSDPNAYVLIRNMGGTPATRLVQGVKGHGTRVTYQLTDARVQVAVTS